MHGSVIVHNILIKNPLPVAHLNQLKQINSGRNVKNKRNEISCGLFINFFIYFIFFPALACCEALN